MLIKSFSQLERFRVDQPGLKIASRITAVDALRGFDLFWIIGGGAVITQLANIFPSQITEFMSVQLTHVEWEGFRFYDLIFSLFLFIVGVALPFSFRKRLERSPSKAALWPHIIKRFIILWILGMTIQGNLLDYDPDKLKLYSNTLQAIASGYLIASVFILYLRISWQFTGTILLMIVYWGFLALVPVPGYGPGVITPDGNFAIYIDKLVLGQFQDGTAYTWIISSLNFGAIVMMGVFCGYLLQSEQKINKKVLQLLIAGVVCIIVGGIWSIWLPSVKHIFTSSFVLFSGGICILSLALFLWLIDGLNFKKGFAFFTIIGMNAIFAYCASHLFEFGLVADVVVEGLKQYSAEWYRFLRSLVGFGVLFLLLWQMYKHKIFIKI